jgi:hypothetical protein
MLTEPGFGESSRVSDASVGLLVDAELDGDASVGDGLLDATVDDDGTVDDETADGVSLVSGDGPPNDEQPATSSMPTSVLSSAAENPRTGV